MDFSQKIVKIWKPLNIIAKIFILDVWLGSEYASGLNKQGWVGRWLE